MIAAWRALPVLVQDAVVAALTALVIAGVPLLDSTVADLDRVTLLWLALVFGVCAPLTLRRRFPMTAALASAGVVLLATALRQPQVGVWVTLAAFGSAAYHRDRVTCWLVVFDFMLDGFPPHLSQSIISVAAGLAPVALGHALRLNHDRAWQQARVERAEERARIARDVHDVVGHHLSAIRLQAVGARRAAPADAGHALESIAEISATALGETRRLLGLLRDDGTEHGTDLGALAARLSGQGLRVRLEGGSVIDQAPLPLRHGVYRIVQESLTNVIRHSGGSKAVVRIARSAGGVCVVVEDEGRTASASAVREGSGLRGMRERAAQLGGTLTAGPREPHGWRVTAGFPLDRDGRRIG
ncbi:histidine kinase [Nonomuraea sp. NPDC049152]|uniref:sensor histidine kinase n=1 Tax=Nonomuraea sp. NPDC049152 TaxID=3154350 RepID=UPI0033E59432